jgi:pimeloyl-ACP methyl ester carboxylesterase
MGRSRTSSANVNGVEIFYEETGSGEPLVLVHGSWVDHHNWDLVAGHLGEHFRVITYDRRGHGDSEGSATQGSVAEDATDLAGLIEHLGVGPAHVAGNSLGSSIAIRLTGARPELFRSLIVHEPPLFKLLETDPAAAPILAEIGPRFAAVYELLEAQRWQEGARLFVETIAFGPGAWENELPTEMRESFIRHAPTFLDELRDPEQVSIDVATLSGFTQRVLLTDGDASPPIFAPVLNMITPAFPNAERHTFTGAAHVPHLTHPDDYVKRIVTFLS